MGEVTATSYHKGTKSDGKEELFALELAEESDGIRKLMAFAPAIESTLRTEMKAIRSCILSASFQQRLPIISEKVICSENMVQFQILRLRRWSKCHVLQGKLGF